MPEYVVQVCVEYLVTGDDEDEAKVMGVEYFEADAEPDDYWVNEVVLRQE